LFGSSINSLGLFGNIKLDKTIDNNSAFFLLTNILNEAKFNGKPINSHNLYLLAAKILGIKKLPSYVKIQGDAFSSYDYATISNTINKYFSGLNEWIRINKNKQTPVPDKYKALVNVDKRIRDAYQNYLLSQALT
jgi:hypothetical protein